MSAVAFQVFNNSEVHAMLHKIRFSPLPYVVFLRQ